MQYINKTTMQTATRDALLRDNKMAKARGIDLTQEDLDLMDAAILVDLQDGDIPTGNNILVDGQYRREYRFFTIEEKSDTARSTRDQLLQETDWMFTSDYPAGGQTRGAWIQYRQDLRDIPNRAGFPNTITWPVKPL